MVKQQQSKPENSDRWARLELKVNLMWKALMFVIGAFAVAILARLVSMTIGHG